MTVKTFCDGPTCEVVVVGNEPGWWIAQQASEVFHFHGLTCLRLWAGEAGAAQSSVRAEAAARERGDLPPGTQESAGAACSHPWHLRAPDRRGDDCPRCGTLVVTEPVPGT